MKFLLYTIIYLFYFCSKLCKKKRSARLSQREKRLSISAEESSSSISVGTSKTNIATPSTSTTPATITTSTSTVTATSVPLAEATKPPGPPQKRRRLASMTVEPVSKVKEVWQLCSQINDL